MSDKVKIAVFVSGGGTNLQALIDSIDSGVIQNGEIALVLSSKSDAYALQRAKNAGIKTAVVQRKEFSQKEFEEKVICELKENNIALIVLAGFMTILSAEFTKKYDKRIINVHPSLIPAFCGKGFYGLRVHEEALRHGVKVSGATVHFVNEIPDGGEIIMQKAIDVLDNDTPETLQRRIMENCEWELLPKSVELVCKKIKAGEI